MPKLWDFFPKSLKILKKPKSRWFYLHKNSIENSTWMIKPKYKIFCDFFSDISCNSLIFVKTTSNDLRESFSYFYSFNIEKDIKFIDEHLKKWMKSIWYIFLSRNSNPIDFFSWDEFHQLIISNDIVHLWYLNNKVYKWIVKLLKERRWIILTENNLNLVTSLEFSDENKKENAKNFLERYIN